MFPKELKRTVWNFLKPFSFQTLIIKVVFVLFLPCASGWSQVVVERSKDKVIISGVPYYLHQVKKGETPYSISRAYGITTDILTKENPSIAGGLKEGQSLRIPARLVSVSPPAQLSPVQQQPRDDSKFIYHILQGGETIYSLSKRYGVLENDIIQSNPGIDIYKISTGFELAIPRKDLAIQKQSPVIQRQSTSIQDTKAYYHKVVKGETMSSIARRYGIPVRELRRANRDSRFPQVGDYLRIPGMKAPEQKPVEVIVPDSVAAIEGEEQVYLEKPSEFTPVTDLHGAINVAVLLPFYLYENTIRSEVDSSKYQKGKRIYHVINRTSDWIYSGSLGFLEMYEGILLAADTLRSQGLDINLHVFDIKSDTNEVTRLIQSGRLDRMNLIIGPVHSRNLSIVAAYAGELGIPVVSPVQLLNNSVLVNKPLLYMANSSLEVAQNSIARKTGDYYNDNIVLVHADTSYADIGLAAFKNRIMAELNARMPAEGIKFNEMIFSSRSVAGSDPVNRLTQMLSENSGNVVIIASEDAPVMSEAIQEAHNLSRKFNMTVIGYPKMRQLKNIDPKFFFELGLMVYSPYWIDYSSRDVKQFCSDFLTKFHTQPSEMSYAWEGYDIAYYFLSGLAIHGKEFLIHPEIHNPDLLYTGFDFRRDSVNNGFENQKLFLIRYTNNYDLELVDETVSFSVR